jgi:hypothetical protein
MTEANASVDSGARPGWRWDVALSFAGARRGYVEQVAQALKARGVRCFYDADEEIELWGKYLAEELPAIYGEQAAAVVIFVSAEYAARDWTRHERRAALGRAVRERREYVLPARFDDTPLPGLLPDVSYVDLRDRTPQQFAAMIAAKLANLGISPSSSPGEPGSGPPGGILVRETDLRLLGVHAAISVPGVPDEVPPEYVPRDVDAAEFGVRAKVAAAAQRGGFVLLVGGSSVGKTRCAAETVKALLPDWWLVHPVDPAEVATLAQTPPPRTVVWLDELQRYLDGEHGLTGGQARALLNAPGPVVIIGTLWSDLYKAYTAVCVPGFADPHAREREVLDLAAVVHIDPEFSPAEQDRARAAAVRDQRLAIALDSAGYGLTQTLAAAPQLVARWQVAQTASPYAWAVLTAALDMARLGARAPLSPNLLRAAAPGYCTSQQRAEAPDNWFEQALAYATEKLHGAAAALSPAGAGMGQVDGYTVADYLIQHASGERRTARVPASTWDAVVSYVSDPTDSARLASSADSRLLYRYAIPLYRRAADAGDWLAAFFLARLLAGRGDVEELRARADAGDGGAAMELASLLAGRGDVEELRARADAGDGGAARELAGLLAGRGDLDQLRARADAGDQHAARRLAELLAEPGYLEELRSQADACIGIAALRAAQRLAELLAERGDVEELRARADAGDGIAARRLVYVLAGRGDVEELRARADAGDGDAGMELARLLAGRGDVDQLVARADAGDQHAGRRLAELLNERGDVEELRARADAGDGDAGMELAELLAGRGDVEELVARADAGDGIAAMELARLLAGRGAVEELRARADAGDQHAARRLAELLNERGDLDGAEQVLRVWADADDWHAAALAELLARRGDLDQLRARTAAGDRYAARRLAEGERFDELRAQADAGDGHAAMRLARLLTGRGDLDGAEQILRVRADAGDMDAAKWLAELLAQRGDLDQLRARTAAGDQYAAAQLPDVLTEVISTNFM